MVNDSVRRVLKLQSCQPCARSKCGYLIKKRARCEVHSLQASQQGDKSQYSAWPSNTFFEVPSSRLGASSTDSDNDEAAESSLRPTPSQVAGRSAGPKTLEQPAPRRGSKQPASEQHANALLWPDPDPISLSPITVYKSCSEAVSNGASGSPNYNKAHSTGPVLNNESQQVLEQSSSLPLALASSPPSVPPGPFVRGPRSLTQ